MDIVPTSSTTAQLALGDALINSFNEKKKIWKIRF
jgi:D-arabinose 5-phosphate isomerase GutQ